MKHIPLSILLLILIFRISLAASPSSAIRIDGSSTVFPLTEAITEEFGKSNPKIRVTVGVSGTGGGFEKFCSGDIDINNASRLIKSSEIKCLKNKKIEYIELPVAFDGISIVVNSKNNWVNSLSVEELNKIWKSGSTVKKWKDLRPEWPDRTIRLYGPGTDSGTFDYFTEVINGKAQSSRQDFTKSEDDNVLVQGVAGDLDSLGFFGFAYYNENKAHLKVVPILNKNSKMAVSPTEETIRNGSYAPLSRQVYIYANKASGLKIDTKNYLIFYLTQVETIAKSSGFIPLPKDNYQSSLEKIKTVLK